jgi:molybdopterin molybdotransferase
MIRVEEAKRLILENTGILDPVEVSLTEAVGLVLSEDIVSNVNLPYFTNSAMDGYAVRSRDVEGASESDPVSLMVRGLVRAGDYPGFTLGEGEAARIMTGAPIPAGADSVVMVEYTEEVGGVVKIKMGVGQGENVRYEGEEIKRGEIALQAGTTLNPASIGFIAGVGINKVRVYRRPRVALVVTGEEVVGLHEDLGPGRIRDTNSIALLSALSQEKAEPVFMGRARDEVSDIRERLEMGLGLADLLIVTGGVSVGDYDYVKGVLEWLGVRPIFWGIAQRPGGPLFFGKKGNGLVFGLPGNPASTLVCFYEYVRPVLHRMIGKRDVFLTELEALLLEDLRKKPDGKTHFIRGYVERRNDSFYARPTGTQGSHILKSFALSNCLIVFPEDSTHLLSGSGVKVHLLP